MSAPERVQPNGGGDAGGGGKGGGPEGGGGEGGRPGGLGGGGSGGRPGGSGGRSGGCGGGGEGEGEAGEGGGSVQTHSMLTPASRARCASLANDVLPYSPPASLTRWSVRPTIWDVVVSRGSSGRSMTAR